MPELPDVEFARRDLERWLRGTTITAATSRDRVVLRPGSPAAFARTLTGRTVREVTRRGKWIRLTLDDGGRLFSHLGMTGEWVCVADGAPEQRFERARVEVTPGRGAPRSIRYLDARRFGRLLVATEDVAEWRALGPDPLEGGLTPKSLGEALARRRRAVKEALMDQTLLAGVGNILATEGLWHARLDPRSRSNALTRGEVAALVRGLKKAIRLELESRDAASGGEPADVFVAYGRAGEPCRRCKHPLRHLVLAGRSTTFCSNCQVRRG